MPPYLVLLSTLTGSNYRCLELIFMVPKVFEPLKFDCTWTFCYSVTLKAPIMTAADNIHKYVFFVYSEKIRLDVSSESSARQRIHMNNQALFSSKDKSKN